MDRLHFHFCDRITATKPEFKRHFFLHMPGEPTRDGAQLSWLSVPEADGDKTVLSHGRTRMFLRTVLPADADIVVRGGAGKEAWGHPLEPAAQYNHVSDKRLNPPLCPWRIEVGDPATGAQTIFLHVFEIADETATKPTPVTLLPPVGIAIGEHWKVRFNATGGLGVSVNDKPLPSTVEISSQYPASAGTPPR